MATKLSIDGVVFVAAIGKEINSSNPYSTQAEPGFWGYIKNVYGLYYGADRYGASGVEGLPNATGTHLVPENYYVRMADPYNRHLKTYSVGQVFTVEKFHNYGSSDGIFRDPSGYRRTNLGFGQIYKWTSPSCVLSIAYTDGSTQTLTFETCPEDIFLIEDEDEICQEACNLANEISRKLGI